ncbi:MAG: glutathione S-transferase, partial [Pseudomonadota bacterium]
MKVYFAPNTRAVRTIWLLEELGLAYDLEMYKLGDKAMRAPEYLSINPNGRVPVVDDGDVRLSESTAIAQYIVARYGDGRMAPPVESPDFPVYLQWLHYAEGMLMMPMGQIVVETILLPPERRSEEHAMRAKK